MNAELVDRLLIREAVENWVLWRDAGDWERFKTVWHPQGRMHATWFQGHFEDFARVSIEGFERGVRILHFLGGTTIDLAGDRAVAQTKMTISQRAVVEGVVCDVVCTGRLHDLFERYEGEWKMRRRQGIYEKDRLDPVDPTQVPKLDPAILDLYPEGYRHLAYLQHRIGYEVKRDMPGLTGPEVEALNRLGASWLAGGSPE
jgi:SnoaL-like domain